MILSAGCGVAAGVVQWYGETGLRDADPTRFPPSPLELVREFRRRWRRGERLRSLIRLAMKPESHGASLLASTKRAVASKRCKVNNDSEHLAIRDFSVEQPSGGPDGKIADGSGIDLSAFGPGRNRKV
eukprot:CAMPEP_0181237024 /NCGR_PEP_ID=MMETSP1096-20121128/38522_1 /TAXON_ID=156174 ORGANISM="Chrysochromulina ericina, Strain CCMP281" /NCGR_SAMPLE_ID=MMETSP1096 /ASSEMBLY_ACC=CAM_ASM_000453 /LENGTH=127 /DNA_ID=CAMNT_0023332311 /DNA_START=232 /DNA_END=615 /DNA_ORIENTATION=+